MEQEKLHTKCTKIELFKKNLVFSLFYIKFRYKTRKKRKYSMRTTSYDENILRKYFRFVCLVVDALYYLFIMGNNNVSIFIFKRNCKQLWPLSKWKL